MNNKFHCVFLLSLVVFLVTACSSAAQSAPKGLAVSALTEDEAIVIIDSAMKAFNTGDYATWSRDWDNAMKTAIKDADFQAYRSLVVDQIGAYISLDSVDILPGLNDGYVRWAAVAKFEKGRIKFIFGFLNDGREIKGVFPEEVR